MRETIKPSQAETQSGKGRSLDGGWKLSSITTRNGTQDAQQATRRLIISYWYIGNPWKDNESHVYTSTPRFNTRTTKPVKMTNS
ncbi:hypothetical protein K0M31_002087 [Melipona bicolor]|uniref:Uncharacterized protein n=1 Tax=Melipona bicolor TaxID=60889 RepID=A0AA40KYI9_9HYME|nr:hypothetical protein K0M31_002087 [Melipona bicolor]